MTFLLIGVLLGSLVLALGIRLGLPRLAVLAERSEGGPEGEAVSIVVAARDEALGIEAAARSLLELTHRPLEIIVVDDRSSDGTGTILDRLAAEDVRLRVIHLTEIPPGWLGKNHALATGAAQARGDWLLFTDADVEMEPETVTRGLGYCVARRLDHLSALPEVRARGLSLQAFITAFSVWGILAARPWWVRSPRSRASLGVGAFNLVRRSAYLRAGGHEAIRLRPDDDLKLGRTLKQSGARSDVVRGRGMIRVEWYRTLREAIEGLMKNSFAVTEYRVAPMIAGAIIYLATGLLPLMAVAVGTPLERLLGGAAFAGQLVAAWTVSRDIPTPRRSALLFPLACVVLAWVVVRAMTVTLVQGGIRWRGTFYPLAELKKNRMGRGARG